MSGAVIQHNHITMVIEVMTSLPSNNVAGDFSLDVHARMLIHNTQYSFNFCQVRSRTSVYNVRGVLSPLVF